MITAQVKLVDSNNIPCLDPANWINFGLQGDGLMLNDLGTSNGWRKMQAYNGRAIIKIDTQKVKSILSVKSPGLSTVFLNLAGK
ncbi:hypothetical protein ACFQ3S_07335 [Mucilaginibacter terrae]|uniref:hypothetical protein n=1 Tax=Mucilaginibacter terrae TaxID=1955052 RepID=UPI00362C0B18